MRSGNLQQGSAVGFGGSTMRLVVQAWLALAVIALALVSFAGPATAQRRVALVVGAVLSVMVRARARLLILDASRSTPLADRVAAPGHDPSHGLARVETTEFGTLIAFATAPGMTADDGNGANSPFTAALLEN